MAELLGVGRKAPTFTLKNQNNEKVGLKNFLGSGPLVVYFYPKAMTPGCTLQAQCLTKSQSNLKKSKITVIGVSPDSPDRLKKFEQKEGLNFTLLADEEHQLAEKFGVWQKKKNYGREYMGIVRTTFIIDTHGKIVHVMDKVNTKTHHEDVLSWIEENMSS